MRWLASAVVMCGCSHPVPLATATPPAESKTVFVDVESPNRPELGEIDVVLLYFGARVAFTAPDLSACRIKPMIGWVVISAAIGDAGEVRSSAVKERVGIPAAAAACVQHRLRSARTFPGEYVFYVAFR
jgi:hypothetical protein